MNITEERTLNMPLGESAEGITNKMSGIAKDTLKLSLQESSPKRMKLGESSQLRNGDNTLLRVILWTQQLEHHGIGDELVMEMLTHFEHKDVFKLYDDLRKANLKKEILVRSEDVLIKYWKKEKISSQTLFGLLWLDRPNSLNNPRLYTPTELERFEKWIKFSTENSDRSIVDVCWDFRDLTLVLMIRDGLRQIKDTQNVMLLEDQLVTRFPYSMSYKRDVRNTLLYLARGNAVKKVLTNRDIELFKSWEKLYYPSVSEEKALITLSRLWYDDKPLGKMLVAATKKKVSEAEPLLKELFRQWNDEAQTGILIINRVAEVEVKAEYDAYVKEMNKGEDQ